MRLQPHENLAVWSIRHELYGHGRYEHTHFNHHHHGCHDHPLACDRKQRCVVRIVEQSHQAQPADCRRSECHRSVCPDSYTPTRAHTRPPLPLEPEIVTIPADLAPPNEPGAIQGYLYGQAVPGFGNLLDMYA